MEQPPENSTSCFVNGSNGTLEAAGGLGYGIVFEGLAVVSCGICVIVMVLIVCLKAYKTFVDRLVLYTTLSLFLFTVSVILQIVSLMENKVKESIFNGVCSAVGYLVTFTLWTALLFLMVISLHLFLLVAFQVKVSNYEKLIVVGIPIISAVIATVPFMTKSYGPSVYGCWIKIRENNYNQSIAGITEQIVLGYGLSIVVAAFGFFTAVYVAWVICRQRGARRQHMEAVKETIHLVLYPIISALVSIVGLANRIDYYIINNPHCPKRILVWLSLVSVPISSIAIIFALLFHVLLTEHRRRKRKRQMQRSESETRYTVPPEFPSEVEPLVITGARPQEPESAYNTIFLTDSIN